MTHVYNTGCRSTPTPLHPSHSSRTTARRVCCPGSDRSSPPTPPPTPPRSTERTPARMPYYSRDLDIPARTPSDDTPEILNFQTRNLFIHIKYLIVYYIVHQSMQVHNMPLAKSRSSYLSATVTANGKPDGHRWPSDGATVVRIAKLSCII